ncbi:hypothetical protein TELCIR_04007 [Teladorsagia circumcincta]|uniref:CUB domain-containing protein n=1 Tax=Teladorsagia circumcincta TaxID=45464 RepID=A0A2G9UUS5_TELCI|nr:hypothetical protein TELCIR_04007 [Teladorsagia circumcincta]
MVANDTRYQESMGSQIISFIDKSMINDHYNCKGEQNAKVLDYKEANAKELAVQQIVPKRPQPSARMVDSLTQGSAQNVSAQAVMAALFVTNELVNCVSPTGCGQTLKAKESKQFLIDKLGFPSGVRDEFTFCNHWIEAPEGKKIEIKINSISHGYAHDGCILGGVEIKTSEDQTRTGFRFCSPNDRNTVLVSASNRVPIITFNRSGQQQIILEYKVVS